MRAELLKCTGLRIASSASAHLLRALTLCHLGHYGAALASAEGGVEVI